MYGYARLRLLLVIVTRLVYTTSSTPHHVIESYSPSGDISVGCSCVSVSRLAERARVRDIFSICTLTSASMELRSSCVYALCKSDTRCTAMLVYDFSLTFTKEVELLWRRKLSIFGVLYFVNRYVEVAAFVPAIVLLFPVSDKVRHCWYFSRSILTFL